MKNVFKPVLATAVFAMVVALYSCTKTCDPGYEGKDCVAMNAKFAGSYIVSDTTTFSDTTIIYGYTMNIVAPSSTPATITMNNFGGLSPTAGVTATVDGNDISFGSTTIGIVTINGGEGTLSGSTLHFNYTSTDTFNDASSSHAVGLK